MKNILSLLMYKTPTEHKHNNRKRTPGRIIQVIQVVAIKSHFYDVPCRGYDGKWTTKKVWVPDKMKTKVIHH